MSASDPISLSAVQSVPWARKLSMLAPVAMAIAYPFVLKAFHAFVSLPASMAGMAAAATCLLAAFAMPAFALACAARLGRIATPTRFELRARRLACIAIGMPPMFVFAGVAIGLLGLPLRDEFAWIVAWLAAGIFVLATGHGEAPAGKRASVARLRVAHGIAGSLIACFVLFHLANHLLGWLGADVHAAVMATGRRVYRAPLVEPVLVALLLFQVASGVRLAWHWSARPFDAHRAFQIGSGFYLAAFVLTHMNSALVSARAVHGIETDWAWASGAPAGLIHDAWNIRLLPHYAFGVFFVLAHLASGLRQVLLAHGVAPATADRTWIAGLAASGLVSIAIIAGLCGARL